MREVVVPGSYQPSRGLRRRGRPAAPHRRDVPSCRRPSSASSTRTPRRSSRSSSSSAGRSRVLQQTGAVDAGLRAARPRRPQRSRCDRAADDPALHGALLARRGHVRDVGGDDPVHPHLRPARARARLRLDHGRGDPVPRRGARASRGRSSTRSRSAWRRGSRRSRSSPGSGFRIGLWVAVTAVAVAFVMWHAHRVKRDPTRSPVYEIDEKKRHDGLHLDGRGRDRAADGARSTAVLARLLRRALACSSSVCST